MYGVCVCVCMHMKYKQVADSIMLELRQALVTLQNV